MPEDGEVSFTQNSYNSERNEASVYFIYKKGESQHVVKFDAGNSNYSVTSEVYKLAAGTYILWMPKADYFEAMVDFTVNYDGGIAMFVERMYSIALGRGSDPNGKADWINRLKTGKAAGADVAEGFIFSDEFKKKNLSDRDYVTVLYKAFMNRNPDTAGLNYWVNYLQTGVSRRGVMDGFLRSNEFKEICKQYKINPGQLGGLKVSETNYNVTSFVFRMYDVVLGRTPDQAGLENWVNNMVAGKITVKQMSSEFVFSKEMNNKNLNSKAYVTVLYNSFLGRGLDPQGEKDWVVGLDSGKYKRKDVFNGVVYSPEFKEIARQYGLVVG